MMLEYRFLLSKLNYVGLQKIIRLLLKCYPRRLSAPAR
jgi:hypothetical protein